MTGGGLLWLCCYLLLLCVIDSTSSTTSSDQPHHSNHHSHHSNVRHYRHSSTSRNIYIDLGANNGDSVKAFVDRLSINAEDIAYDGSKAVAGGWQALLNRPDNASTKLSTWHILAFEASEGHNGGLEDIRRNLTDHKYVASVKMFNGTAITTYDGTITFIWDGSEASAGATTIQDSFSAIGKKVTIPCMDIVTLFKREHISIEDFVVVKMDVEGAEYDIVKRIITSGLYRYIDRLAVEW